MSGRDSIRQYLASRGCANHVVDGGWRRLLLNWEANSRCPESCFYEFANDLDGRTLLFEIESLVESENREEFLERCRLADDVFRQNTVEARSQVWSIGVNHWWLFRMPVSRDDSWDK